MSAALDELTGALAAQADELRRLLPLLEAQQAAVTGADGGRVAALMFGQAPILRRLVRLDQQRQVAASDLAAELGLPGAPTLSAIAERLPDAGALRALQHDVRLLLEAVDVRSRRTALLLDRAAECIEGLVRTVMGAGRVDVRA